MEENIKKDLFIKIEKIDKIFCEYNNHDNLYDPLVFLSNFTCLQGNAHTGLFWDSGIENFDCELFSNNLRKILNHVGNIFLLIKIIEEFNYLNEQKLPLDWRDRIGLAIKYFHIEYRSLTDFIPEMIFEDFKIDTHKVKKKKFDSFNSFLEWLKNNQNLAVDLLDENLVNSILSVQKCFSFIRTIRDSVVHYAGDGLIFGRDTSDGIFFTLSKFGHHETLIKGNFIKQYFPIIKYNENDVFKFEPYATILLLYLLKFLEDFCEFFIQKYNFKNVGDCRSKFSGMAVYKKWLSNLKSELGNV